jgi:hypothetical protein
MHGVLPVDRHVVDVGEELAVRRLTGADVGDPRPGLELVCDRADELEDRPSLLGELRDEGAQIGGHGCSLGGHPLP